MTIRARDIAFIKTTGETVFVLEYPTSTGKVSVRRPVASQDGINHNTEVFDYDELETKEEQNKRFLSEREEILAKYVTSANQAATSSDNGFSSN